MPARSDDPQWLKNAYAEGRVIEKESQPFAIVDTTREELIEVHNARLEESETDFEKRLVAFAQEIGWAVMAVRRNVCVQKRNSGETYSVTPWLYDGEGWVDLTLVRERIVFFELKSEKGRMRPEQSAWRERLLAAGAEVYVWRPSQWNDLRKVLERRGA